jgi:dihydroorotate dehydrogenase
VRSADTARRYLRAGADLVQVYTAVAESGPGIAGALLAATARPTRM